MIRVWVYRLAVAGISLLCMLSSASGADEGAARAPWDKYKPLLERTIFNRYRPPRRERPGEGNERPVIKPQRDIVLTGIVEQGEDRVAFLENVASRTVTKVAVGDIVVGGKITSITLDGIEYELDGTTLKIEPGKNLEGAERTRSSSSSSTISAPPKSDKPAGEPAAETGDSNEPAKPPMSDAERRLRERREQELGK